MFWSVCARVSGLSRDQDKAGGVDYIDDIARRKEVDLCHEHSLHSQSVIQTRKMLLHKSGKTLNVIENV